MNEGSRPRQIKLWFNLHGIILQGKPIRSNQEKELESDLKNQSVS